MMYAKILSHLKIYFICIKTPRLHFYKPGLFYWQTEILDKKSFYCLQNIHIIYIAKYIFILYNIIDYKYTLYGHNFERI